VIKALILLSAIYSFSQAMSGENIVNLYGCMECHGIKKGKTAPAFIDIAKNAKQKRIEQSIKNGSQGKYKNFKQNIMPEFEYFTKKELKKISTWILSLKKNEK